MKYVLDASVAIRYAIPGPLTQKATALRDDYRNKIHELLAPDTFVGETASALTKAERQKLIPVGQAMHLFGKIANAWPVLHSYLPFVTRAIEISSQTRAGFYDCLYIALAEQENCEMVTADDKLLKNVQQKFPFVIHLSGLP